MQSIYLVLCIVLMAWLAKGRLVDFGFTWGTFRPTWRFFLWILPALALGLASAMSARGGHDSGNFLGFTKLQTVVFVWIYSSFCEEILTRGLLQTLLQRAAGCSGRGLRNYPMILSGLFFGAMHLGLVPRLGAGALPIVAYATYLGLVAAYYRQRSASLAPAILLHMLFNIAGTLPAWVVLWVR